MSSASTQAEHQTFSPVNGISEALAAYQSEYWNTSIPTLRTAVSSGGGTRLRKNCLRPGNRAEESTSHACATPTITIRNQWRIVWRVLFWKLARATGWVSTDLKDRHYSRLHLSGAARSVVRA